VLLLAAAKKTALGEAEGVRIGNFLLGRFLPTSVSASKRNLLSQDERLERSTCMARNSAAYQCEEIEAVTMAPMAQFVLRNGAGSIGWRHLPKARS
jgi:hypothetical protein